MRPALNAFRLLVLCLLAGGCGAVRLPAQPLDSLRLSLPLDDLSAFRPGSAGWQTAGEAWARWDAEALAVEPGAGVLVNRGGGPLFTVREHGDLELDLEFLLPKGADAGLFLQGRYEVRIADSWGVRHPRFGDAGGLSPPVRSSPARALSGGFPPRSNASRAPGLWQHMRIVFRAPRFDPDGRKTADARIVEIVLNGVKVQENVALAGPSPGAVFAEEAPIGPLVIQAAEAGMAFRNIRYHPYEQAEPVRLADVRYTLYEGEFAGLDDLETTAPVRSGEAYGFVWDLFGPRADRFAARWEGTIHIPAPGAYRFAVGFNWVDEIPYDENAVPGHGRLTIGGREVAFHAGKEPYASGTVTLEAGPHPFTLVYFKNRRLWRPIVFFEVEGGGRPAELLNAPRTVPEPETSAPLMAVDPVREPYVLRSFVEHEGVKKVNALSVGDPRGVHYTLDLENGGLLYAWKGAFADAGAMWHSRGEQQTARPLGQRLTLPGGPALALLPAPSASWPADTAAAPYRFAGYTLDADGRPTVRYRLGETTVEDRLEPDPDGRFLTRRITLSPGTASGTVWLRVAEGADVREREPGLYTIDGAYFIRLDETSGAPVLRAANNRRALLVPLRPGHSAAYTILW